MGTESALARRVESWLLLAPSTALASLVGALSGLPLLRGDYSGAPLAGCMVLLLATHVAIWNAMGRWIRQGDAALAALPAWAVGGIRLTLALVAVGALAAVSAIALSNSGIEALAGFLIGLPALVPASHVLRARRSGVQAPDTTAERMVLGAGLFIVLLLAATQFAYTGPKPFDRATWDELADTWDDPIFRRHRMADWLLATRELQGRTRTEVIAMLGEPPDTGYFRDWSMVYPLGAERGFMSIDSEWLVLRLDDHDRVVEARLVRD